MGKPSVQLFAFNSSIAKELVQRLDRIVRGEEELPPPSRYQERIYRFVKEEKGSGIVRARAGTGKSTTCLGLLFSIPGVDLSDVRAKTFHSVGYSALLRRFKAMGIFNVEPNGSKLRQIVRGDELFVGGEEDPARKAYGDFVAKLVGLARGQGVGVLEPDVDDAWYSLIQHHDLFLDDEKAEEAVAVDYARKLLRISNEQAKRGIIDFDDQLYLPLLWGLKLWQNDYVIVDEAQDTNPVRRAMARLALRPGGRLIAVGDDRQSIYGFTGASHDALDLIARDFACVDLPLTVCYRCAKSIVRYAQEVVPDLEHSESAPEGEVLQLPMKEWLPRVTDRDAVLCRQTAPLVQLAFHLIGKGRGVVILGRDIGKDLAKLVESQRAKGVDNLLHRLAAYREREVAKWTAKGEETKAEAVADRVACVEMVIEGLPETQRTVPAVIAKLAGLFDDSARGLLSLATIHKSKGREWETVVLYRPDLLPSKWARQEWQAKQEENLDYVWRTRAKLTSIRSTDDVGGER